MLGMMLTKDFYSPKQKHTEIINLTEICQRSATHDRYKMFCG